MLYQVVRDAHPDVLGLQVALGYQLDDLRGALPYSEIGVGRDDGVEAGEYSAILYDADRFDVDDTRSVETRMERRSISSSLSRRRPRRC